jgi:hypothetical protein
VAPDSSDMPFDIGEETVRDGTIVKRAIVMTPKSAVVVGLKRINDLRKPAGISRVERWLIEQSQNGTSSPRILLFRAVNSAGERVWQFDPNLSEPDLEEGGYVVCKALLPFHRRLMAAGVVLMVHTDWGLRECYAMRSGVQRALAEFARSPNPDPTRDADRWVLNHMLLHAALDLAHIVASLLPGHLTMVERRWPRVRELIARLPPTAID